MAAPNLSEIVTTTLRNRSKKIADNVTNHNALLRRLQERGNIKLTDGGRTIVRELDYAENSTFKWYSGAEVLDVNPSEVISAAEFNWKQANVNVIITGLEGEIQNAGPSKIVSLLNSRVRNAERTMQNNLSIGIYADGTGSTSKEIGGLQLLVADDPATGTVGGIDRSVSTNAFWKNITFDATSTGGAAATSANIQSYMNRVWVQVVRGTDMPDLIVGDNTYWRLYLESMQAIQRVTNEKMTSAGFMNLKYMTADVVFDGGGGCPANHLYFLNTDYLFFEAHKNRNMVPLDNKTSINQDTTVVPLLWAGNMTLSNAALQAVLKD
jgi:hypothetical protein